MRRPSTSSSTLAPPPARPRRIFGIGTLFLTHTITVPKPPIPGTSTRATNAIRTRGGNIPNAWRILAQLPGVNVSLVAPLSGDVEGRSIRSQLEEEKISTRYCRVWDELGVPSAWVLQHDGGTPPTVINHNPLPDLTHADFVSLLGPILAPENYPSFPNTSPPTASPVLVKSPSNLSPNSHQSQFPQNQPKPPPMDWLHVDARSARTALANLAGVHSLAAERGWRQQVVLSLDLTRLPPDADALLPHADVLFLPPPPSPSAARNTLLALASKASPHALLIIDLGPSSSGGAALLSIPRKEYLQASAWSPPPFEGAGYGQDNWRGSIAPTDMGDHEVGDMSVQSGSFFFVDPNDQTSTSTFTAFGSPEASPVRRRQPPPQTSQHSRRGTGPGDDHGHEGEDRNTGIIDAAGARAAFIAGMIWALLRAELPSSTHSPPPLVQGRGQGQRPGTSGSGATSASSRVAETGWGMDECLRFACELSGRKARMTGWTGLGKIMEESGWLEGKR